METSRGDAAAFDAVAATWICRGDDRRRTSPRRRPRIRYTEYFQYKARAEELLFSKRVTDDERARLRAERDVHLERAKGLLEAMQNPPTIPEISQQDEPEDFEDFLEHKYPEPGCDHPRGWWREAPPGPDRDRARQYHDNAVKAWENRDKWWYVSLPEDAAGRRGNRPGREIPEIVDKGRTRVLNAPRDVWVPRRWEDRAWTSVKRARRTCPGPSRRSG